MALRSARPRDLTQLRSSLAALPALRAALAPLDSPLLARAARRASASTRDERDAARSGDRRGARARCVRDGDVIAAGYDAELDELRRIATHTDEFLLELERRERERTGIAGLKLGYNRVQGFFIEVARAQAERVPKRLHAPPDRQVAPSASSPRSSRASRTRCSARASGRSRARRSSTRSC